MGKKDAGQIADAADESGKKPTLKTIARLTGLAVPTVSRALGGALDISPVTRARVRQVADEIGYVPNRAGVRLRTGRTNVISLVLSSEHEVMNHTARLISSVAGGLRGTPFHLIITPYFTDEDPMKPIRYIVETGSADAVIFNQIRPDDPRAAYLLERGFPFVTHGRTQWSDRHPFCDFDNGAFARLAVRKMAGRGRRDLVLIAPPTDQNYAQDMIRGGEAEAASLGLPLRVLEGASSDQASERIEGAIAAYLAQGGPMDGVICPSSNSSLAAMAAVEAAGHEIGATLDLCAKEVSPLLKKIRKAVLVVHEDIGAAGAFMAKAAMARVRAPDEPPLQWIEVPEQVV